jgi:hypothetical protein
MTASRVSRGRHREVGLVELLEYRNPESPGLIGHERDPSTGYRVRDRVTIRHARPSGVHVGRELQALRAQAHLRLQRMRCNCEAHPRGISACNSMQCNATQCNDLQRAVSISETEMEYWSRVQISALRPIQTSWRRITQIPTRWRHALELLGRSSASDAWFSRRDWCPSG